MSQYINKSHNVTALLYHLVFPAKYRRVVFDDDVEKVLKEVCLEIEERYEIKFLEIGTDKDHVHFLVQSVPRYSVTKIVTMLKSITAKEIFKRCPQVKKKLWGGEFWTDGYFASTVGKHGDEATIGKYVKNQGQDYQQLHSDFQPGLFWIPRPSGAGIFIWRFSNRYSSRVKMKSSNTRLAKATSCSPLSIACTQHQNIDMGNGQYSNGDK